MEPILFERPPRVVAVEQVFAPLLVGNPLRVSQSEHRPSVEEFVFVAHAAPETGQPQHQWATPAAAASSIRRPSSNRARLKLRMSSCGAPCATVQAIVWPPAGIALNPPVPQPALM